MEGHHLDPREAGFFSEGKHSVGKQVEPDLAAIGEGVAGPERDLSQIATHLNNQPASRYETMKH